MSRTAVSLVATRPPSLRMLDVSRVITNADQLSDALTAVTEAGGRQMIRSCSGVLRRPDVDMDGDLLGTRLPR